MDDDKKMKEIEEQIRGATPEQFEVWLAQLNHKTAMSRERYIAVKEGYKKAEEDHEYRTTQAIRMLIANGSKITAAKMDAETTQEFKERQEILGKLREGMDQAKLAADNYERSWDTIRSILASRNAERRMA